jgi:molybdate transport system substrate-binding protein
MTIWMIQRSRSQSNISRENDIFMTSRRKITIYLLTGLGGGFGLSSDLGFSQTTLRISAAISLRAALLEVKSAFEQENAAIQIQYNFAASGVLRQQIERGAAIDIFASADLDNMNSLAKQKLIKSNSQVNFARNQLVVIVSPRNSIKIDNLKDLLKLKRIAIGNINTVSAGKYAKQALEKVAIYAELAQQRKLIFAENVRQVQGYVEQESVDAGLVYLTDVVSDLDSKKVEIALRLPFNFTESIIYPIAILSESRNVESAQKFIRFVSSDRGQKILSSKGFLSP